jgi:hypothetical protein
LVRKQLITILRTNLRFIIYLFIKSYIFSSFQLSSLKELFGRRSSQGESFEKQTKGSWSRI